MATLNENIAKTKENFRNIRDAINVVGDVAGFNDLTNESVEEYPARINDVTEMYGQSKYDEGYEHGKADYGGGVNLSKCKYIEKQATGKVIVLNDVSEVYHKVKVYADEPTEVDVYGKNLFDISTDTRFTQQEDGSYITNERVPNIVIPYALSYGTYILSYDMSCAVGRNARIRIHLKDGTSVEDYKVSTGEFLHYEKVITGEIVGWGIYYSTTPQAGELIIKNAQIEVGSMVTAYEPCNKQTITATPVGTEANSMCPIMTFFADSDITVDYYSSFGMAEKELAMWNAFTNSGNRKNFDYAFDEGDYTGYTIPAGLCKPRQRIGAMFYNYKGVELPKGVDCSEFDVTSTTKNHHCTNTFAYAQKIKHIYDMLIPAVRYYSATFLSCILLEFIEIIRSDENTTFDTNCFNGCTSLTHVIFSGVIANDINLQWSPLLDEESLMSLVDSLKFMEDVFDDDGELVENNAYTKTVTLSPESWAILDGIMHPNWEGDPDEPYTYKTHVGAQQWNIG